jgi:hypothetical protein
MTPAASQIRPTNFAGALAATTTQIVTAAPSTGTTRCAIRAAPLRRTTK